MTALQSFFKRPLAWIPISATLVCLSSLPFWRCTEVAETCGDGKSLNPHAQFCYQNRTYDKCEGEEYNPEKQGCVNNLLMDRCGRNFYDPDIEFCYTPIDGGASRIYDRCNGQAFNPTSFTECNGVPIEAKCGKDYYPSDISFCYNERVYPKCNRQEYSPDSLFCFGDVLYEMCNGQTYNASTHECRNGVLTEKAQFTGHTLNVKVEPEGAGEVTRVPDLAHYAAGAYVNVTAVAKDGWWFDKWSGASTSSNSTVTIHMIGDLELTANFLPLYTLTINVIPEGAGAMSSRPNQASYPAGTRVTVTANHRAGSGYIFSGWSGDTTNLGNPITVTMNDNMTLTANFKIGEIIYGTLTDNRNGSQIYKTITIGTQTWMAENLNYATSYGSWCYGEGSDLTAAEIQVNCNKYGRLYAWNAAMMACPSGWHLPTREEWDVLVNYADSSAGTKLKARSPYWNGTDDYGFSALPGGYRYIDGSSGNLSPFSDLGSGGFWWSATATESDATNAYSRDMGTGGTRVGGYYAFKGYGLSARCVRD
jgi:uncharacterized protein (TIGR02145 family)/uncharacterized repeat protein (TIGR02543 family)